MPDGFRGIFHAVYGVCFPVGTVPVRYVLYTVMETWAVLCFFIFVCFWLHYTINAVSQKSVRRISFSTEMKHTGTQAKRAVRSQAALSACRVMETAFPEQGHHKLFHSPYRCMASFVLP